jgi:hypothetical protein
MAEISQFLGGQITYIPKSLGGPEFAQLYVQAIQAGALLSLARTAKLKAAKPDTAKLNALISLRQLQLQEIELAAKFRGTSYEALLPTPISPSVYDLTTNAITMELQRLNLFSNDGEEKGLGRDRRAQFESSGCEQSCDLEQR